MGDNVIAIQAILPCINCYQKSCGHHSCMREIQPAHVLDVLSRDEAKGIYRIPARILAPETVDS
jgi:ADP-heptose:LPS heptosyltransferase